MQASSLPCLERYFRMLLWAMAQMTYLAHRY